MSKENEKLRGIQGEPCKSDGDVKIKALAVSVGAGIAIGAVLLVYVIKPLLS